MPKKEQYEVKTPTIANSHRCCSYAALTSSSKSVLAEYEQLNGTFILKCRASFEGLHSLYKHFDMLDRYMTVSRVLINLLIAFRQRLNC